MKDNINESWKRFINEAAYPDGDAGSGTPASRQGKEMIQKLDQLKSATEDPEGGHSIGADEVGEFIMSQGGEEEALAYIEAMRQEIIDLMDDENAEVQFTKDNPQFNPNFAPRQAVEDALKFYQTTEGRMKWRMARQDFAAMACDEGDPEVRETYYSDWKNDEFKYVLGVMGEEVPSCQDD